MAANFITQAKQALIGKQVINVRYMDAGEADSQGFNLKPIVIEFDDGTYIFPSMDDEGNDAGALFGGNYNNSKLNYLFPVNR